MSTPLATLAVPDAELVIGLVGELGTNLERVEDTIQAHLAEFDYQCSRYRLSSFLKRIDEEALGVKLLETPEAERLRTYMNAGNAVRRLTKRGDFLALFATSEIRRQRGDDLRTHPNTCHLLRSLKHPDEVRLLRKVYGAGFFLIGAYSPEDVRAEFLSENKGISAERAALLIGRDRHEKDEYGQQTRDTFQLADAFVDLTADDFEDQLFRFLDLIFGAPHQTPTQQEHAMFLAHAAALRSADLSRQVGAVLTSRDGEIIATGANDVPQAGGGLYWAGSDDQRDYQRGFDSNEKERDEIIVKAMKNFMNLKEKEDNLPIEDPGQQREEAGLLKEGKKAFAGTGLLSLTEFGRAVHAEMEALLACARIGVSPQSGTLYCTTYPCHNCMKHLIAAGVREVFYIEPYPKSKAEKLHSDAIIHEGKLGAEAEGAEGRAKLRLRPFVGIGPRRYMDLFSMTLSSGDRVVRKRDGKAVQWKRSQASPRIPMSPMSYIDREGLVIDEFLGTVADEESS